MNLGGYFYNAGSFLWLLIDGVIVDEVIIDVVTGWAIWIFIYFILFIYFVLFGCYVSIINFYDLITFFILKLGELKPYYLPTKHTVFLPFSSNFDFGSF